MYLKILIRTLLFLIYKKLIIQEFISGRQISFFSITKKIISWDQVVDKTCIFRKVGLLFTLKSQFFSIISKWCNLTRKARSKW